MDEATKNNESLDFGMSRQNLDSFGSFAMENCQAGTSRSPPFEGQGARPPPPFGIQRFYTNAQREGPWDPLSLTPTNATLTEKLGPASYLPQTSDLINYRDADPLDCDTVTGDSGYGTNSNWHVESVASNPSVHEDDALVDSLLIKPLSSLGRELGTSIAGTAQSALEPRHYRCDVCPATVKTRSELKKHKQRHSKPYHCPHSGCRRSKEGFSTKNDLTRHRKSVHREHEGNGRLYVCREGSCVDKVKVWPRADNFRHHLEKVHQKVVKADANLNDYIHNPISQRDTLKGVGSSVADIPHHRQDYLDRMSETMSDRDPAGLHMMLRPQYPDQLSHSDLPNFPSRRAFEMQGCRSAAASSFLGDIPNFPHIRTATNFLDFSSSGTELLSQRPSLSSEDQVEISLETFVPLHPANHWATHTVAATRSFNDGSDATEKEESQGMSRNASTSSAPAPRSQPTKSHLMCDEIMGDSEPISVESILSLITSEPSRIAELLKALPKEYLKAALEEDTATTDHQEPPLEEMERKMPTLAPVTTSTSKSTSTPTSTLAPYRCPKCPKLFNRPCELKCTFRDCEKDFGSKNDWKRHESSQHTPLETWHCAEEGCNKVCQRRDNFRYHLEKEHGLKNSKEVDEKLESCRMGRHCGSRFWCGFCLDTIEVVDNSINSWTQRFDHIDNHLFGKAGLEKKNSHDWQQPKIAHDVDAPPAAPGPSVPDMAVNGARVRPRMRNVADANSSRLPNLTTEDIPHTSWTCRAGVEGSYVNRHPVFGYRIIRVHLSFITKRLRMSVSDSCAAHQDLLGGLAAWLARNDLMKTLLCRPMMTICYRVTPPTVGGQQGEVAIRARAGFAFSYRVSATPVPSMTALAQGLISIVHETKDVMVVSGETENK
ncbi:hypothetical protein S7711_07007 [Stachybotrys chartarum IBT 7711]|uniref:C2H2-type domain-containing protein n=1 Tax=Stachybotrys chartarum (strain CBS 109288 / IBT 7711) TaxID=1280523 RepID=A0A084AYD1_STACB|nr:hypothetical protein S7711_07007 [Stachybotrys chartarum IBT 7711]